MGISYRVPLLKRLLSFLVPITVRQDKSDHSPYLELLYFRGQWQLATEDALYSDGDRYLPFRMAFRRLSAEKLSGLGSCLLLGTGLGSIVQILHKKYRCKARFTLVEHDEKILKWAVEALSGQGIGHIESYCQDAGAFVDGNVGGNVYELVCVDIFNGREVPPDFTTPAFLRSSFELVAPNGIWFMNYIVTDDEAYAALLSHARDCIGPVEVVEKGQNRILMSWKRPPSSAT